MDSSDTNGNAKPTSSTAQRLLLIEDDPDQQLLIGETLEEAFGEGLVDICGSCKEVDEVADLTPYVLALCDVNLPDGNGLDILDSLQQRAPELPVMMLTGQNDTATASRAIRGGACDYVVNAGGYLETRPLTIANNRAAGETAVARHRRETTLRDQAQRLTTDLADERSARELAERE
ncbi:MAG: response regulator, partial [Planctomycetota bacterium]